MLFIKDILKITYLQLIDLKSLLINQTIKKFNFTIYGVFIIRFFNVYINTYLLVEI